MTEIDRRGFLAAAAAGAAVPLARSDGDDGVASARGLEAIAEVARETPRAEAIERFAAMHRDGADWRDLLGGVFLAGVHDVVPRPVGFKFHAVMMTASAYDVAARVTDDERMLAVMFNLDDFKRAQADDARGGGDWQLPGRPSDPAAPDAAAAAVASAMDAWDDAAADRAVVGLAAWPAIDDAFEVLWPYVGRDFGAIGHKMIYGAQAYRTLQQIGWRYGEPVLRSLVYGLLDGKPGQNDRAYAANRELAAKIRPDWARGALDPEASRRLLAKLRDTETERAAAVVVDLLGAGVAPASIWDGLRLFALEILMRRPGLLAVHPLTTLNAFHYAFSRSRSDATRRLLLLQAASWSRAFQDFFVARGGFDAARSGIDELGPVGGGEASVSRAFLAKDRERAAGLAFAVAREAGVAELSSTARRLLLRKAVEHHDYKFAAAVLEETELSHERWRPAMIAAAMFYLRGSAQPDGAVYRRARPLLGRG